MAKATSEINKDFNTSELGKNEMLHKLYEPVRKRCHMKNASKSSSLPSLPSLESVKELITNVSTEDMITLIQEEIHTVLDCPVPTIPLDLNTESTRAPALSDSMCKEQSIQNIETQVVIPKVITKQPKKTIDKYFMESKTKYVDRVSKLLKVHELPTDADSDTEVNYGGILMAKNVADR